MRYKPQHIAQLLNETFPQESTANISLWRETPQWLSIVYNSKGGIPNGHSTTSLIGYAHTHKPRILIPHAPLGDDASSIQWRIPAAASKIGATVEAQTPPQPTPSIDALPGIRNELYADDQSISYSFTEGFEAFALQPTTGLALVLPQNVIGWNNNGLRGQVTKELRRTKYRVFTHMTFEQKLSEEAYAQLRDILY